jgi:hypothetical protein
MNWDQVEGQWKQIKGSAKQQWGKLTDDDLDVIAGKRTSFGKLAGALWYPNTGSEEASRAMARLKKK